MAKQLRLIRGSEVSSYLTCRRSWKLAWCDHLKKRALDGKLFFGTLFHKYMEFFYKSGEPREAWAEAIKWMDGEDLSAMDQVFIDELLQLFEAVARNYENEYAKLDILSIQPIATELRFAIPLHDDEFMLNDSSNGIFLRNGNLDFAYEGTIDLLYLENGLLKFKDHKTVSSIDRYVNNAVLDRQISRYWWALTALGQGYGYVRVDDSWVQVKKTKLYELIKDQSPSEFIYNIVGKKAPKEPKVLKSGKLSQDKNQDTTYDLYKRAIIERNLPMSEYTEMLNMLEQQGNKFLRRVSVVRSMSECDAAMEDFAKVGREIMKLRNMLEFDPEQAEQHLFWNINWDTPTFNQYYPLIQAEVKDENVELVKGLLYETKEPEEPEYIEVEED